MEKSEKDKHPVGVNVGGKHYHVYDEVSYNLLKLFAEDFEKLEKLRDEEIKKREIYKAALIEMTKERDEFALLLFQPCGASHHDANKCPYCKENLNGKPQ